MYNFDCIIPLGQACNISILMQNAKLKKETSLFEWFDTVSLCSISNIIKKLINNEPVSIIKHGNDICIEEVQNYSSHYRVNPAEFFPTFKRRSDRFLNSIKNNKKILFIRFEIRENKLSLQDVDYFINNIKCINPDHENIKLLLISKEPIQFHHDHLINKVYSANYDNGCSSPEINQFFQNTLKEVGYNIHDVSTTLFTDRSEV